MFFIERPHPTWAGLRDQCRSFDLSVSQGQRVAYPIKGIIQKSFSEHKQGPLYQRYSKGLPLQDQN